MNKCKVCGYTWHPIDIHFSIECPNCGSTDFTYATFDPGCMTYIAVAVVFMIILGYFISRNVFSFFFDCAEEKTYKVTTKSLSVHKASTIESDVMDSSKKENWYAK
jgi:predicted  nucleic acid-binding Zn-ribbon protein